MVTLSFIVLITLLIFLLTLFDMKLFELSFFEAILNILFSEIAIGRYISIFGVALGMISSLIIDYRIITSKKESNTDERHKDEWR